MKIIDKLIEKSNGFNKKLLSENFYGRVKVYMF